MATPFDADLARLADLSDEELAELESSITAEFDKADQAGDEEAMQALADALDAVITEKQRRGAPEEAAPEEPVAEEAPMAAAAETATTETEAEAEVAEEAETKTEVEAEAETEDEAPAEETVVEAVTEAPEETKSDEPAVVADSTETEGTAQVTNTKIDAPEVPEGREAVETIAASATIVAGADIPGTGAGTVFADRRQMSKAYAARVNTLRRLTGGDGEKVIIASIQTKPDEAHVLNPNDPDGNSEKIRRAIDPHAPKSLTAAAGDGWCSPLTTRYDIFGQGVTDRPVRDALPGFNADRGGIQFFKGLSLADVAGAVGIWDQSNDPASDTKNIGSVACPTSDSAEIYAVTKALKFSNMAARVFPEMVDNANDLTMVAHARLAESSLLAGIKTQSTALAGATQTVGTVRQLLNDVALAAAYYRDRNRLDPKTPLRSFLPSWILEAVRADITLTGPNKDLIEGLTESEVTGFFSDRYINVSWTLDSAVPGTNGGGFYAAAAGSVPSTPGTVQYPMFVEGSFLFLDGGTLDLGVIRDSSLVQKNEYIQFAETFENVVNVGAESLWITSEVAISGQFVAGTQSTITTP